MLEEVVLPIPMGGLYPDEFLAPIRSTGFTITGSWGGYAGEPYGQGKELVVEFAPRSALRYASGARPTQNTKNEDLTHRSAGSARTQCCDA